MSVTYSFHVDWDATDWQAVPDFSAGIDDITAYVQNCYIDRGKNDELGNAVSGTLDLTLTNEDKRFTPTYAAGPLFGKIRPWLPVRVRATVNGSTLTIYTGFISKLRIDPHIDKKKAYMYCTDGMDLLARQLITQDEYDRETCNDGEAMTKILDASGWPAGKRNLDNDSGDIVKYPACTEY